jgi:S1-C subfamily serine protease
VEILRDEIRISGKSNASLGMILPQIYNQTRMSVVLISITNSLGGGGQGSGFIYDYEGHIITNNHVIEEATIITVTLSDGIIVEAGLIGRDPFSDLAVIKIDIPKEKLYPVTFGNSSQLIVGENVVAIGAPFGLDTTMTSGIVSATGRQMDAPGGYPIVDVIQTDAAINPGNSGGPLLNLYGQVIGMNTAIISSTNQFSGIGFAIPSDTIIREIENLIETGTYEHPWVGIAGWDITPSIAQAMNLEPEARGALIGEIREGGPAEKSGLKGGDEVIIIDNIRITIGGDIIIGIDDRAVNSFYDLTFLTERYHKPGDRVELLIIRKGDLISINLKLGVRPPV